MKVIPGCLLAAFLILTLTTAHALSPGVPFQPGQWQISSTVTPSTGKTVKRQQLVCAKNAGQTWQTHTANQQCGSPTITPSTHGYNIQLSCTGNAGPIHWKSASIIHEVLSNKGSAFQATGSTDTTVSYPGRPPLKASASIHATGQRVGACK